jgi:hypothetical protein
MKIKPLHWVILGLALALTVSVCDGLRYKDKTSVLIGRAEEANAALQVLVAEKGKVIVAQDKIIAAKTKEIADIIAQSGQPSPSEVEKDKTIAALKKKNAELAAAGDYKAAYEGAQAEIRAWSDKFTLAEARHAGDIFSLNASWQGKYAAQVVISESWKAQCEGANRLLSISQALNKSLAIKVKKQAIIGNLKTGAVVAAAGWIIFSAIKGK